MEHWGVRTPYSFENLNLHPLDVLGCYYLELMKAAAFDGG
jgi:hypothetical protein